MDIPERIEPQGLTAEGWAPFGWLPRADTDPRDGDHHLEFAWDDPHLNVIGHARTEVPATCCSATTPTPRPSPRSTTWL